jgi:hypothetical protein
VKLLIATGDAAGSPSELPDTIRSLIEQADEVFVIAPTLPKQLDWLMSDTDRARKQADERLQTVLGHIEEIGTTGAGAVGSDEPIAALEDALRDFPADHVLIALRGAGTRGWQERGLLEQLIERLRLPLTVFALDA